VPYNLSEGTSAIQKDEGKDGEKKKEEDDGF
jgi:hypothetical protein